MFLKVNTSENIENINVIIFITQRFDFQPLYIYSVQRLDGVHYWKVGILYEPQEIEKPLKNTNFES
jgi:hypothetical protein